MSHCRALRTPSGSERYFGATCSGSRRRTPPVSFAIVDAQRNVHPVPGPASSSPTNAPCWIAKGAGKVWYTGSTPGHAISVLFSDGAGGVFYQSAPVPGVPTGLAVSPDKKRLAVIYSADDNGYIAVYSIDAYGGLKFAATSTPLGVAKFNGVAISQ